MQRRFEMYKIRDDVPEARVVELEEILRGCGRYIPQLMYSVVARNLSDTGISLVWEHAYESAKSYEEYMRHPYHICVLDRYLLPDAPGLIIENDGLGLGLLGYEIEEPTFLRRDGIRRVEQALARPGAGRAHSGGNGSFRNRASAARFSGTSGRRRSGAMGHLVQLS